MKIMVRSKGDHGAQHSGISNGNLYTIRAIALQCLRFGTLYYGRKLFAQLKNAFSYFMLSVLSPDRVLASFVHDYSVAMLLSICFQLK